MAEPSSSPSSPLIATGTVSMRRPSSHAADLRGQSGEVHLGPPSVPRGRQVVKEGRPVMAGSAQDPAVSTRRDIASRPRIALLDGAGGEDALLHTGEEAARHCLLAVDQNRAGPVAPLLVLP